jgi:hypothetical protein
LVTLRCALVLVLAVVSASCDSRSPTPDTPASEPDPDARITCWGAGPTNAEGIPTTCDWEWTCTLYAGIEPEFSMHCEGDSPSIPYSCVCRQSGAQTAVVNVMDACISFTNAKDAANAACKFTRTID